MTKNIFLACLWMTFAAQSAPKLIDLNFNRVSLTGDMLEELSSNGEDISTNRNLSRKQIRDYLVEAWSPKFEASVVLQNADLQTHLQLDSYAGLFPTQTTLGEVYGDEMLVHGATYDIAELKRRQELIKTLSENEHLRSVVQQTTGSVRAVEDALLDILHPKGSLEDYVKMGYLSAQSEPQQTDWLLLSNPLRLPRLLITKYSSLLAIPAEMLTFSVTFSGFFSIQNYGLGAFLNGAVWRTGSALLGGTSLMGLGFASYSQYQAHERLRELNALLVQRLKAVDVLLKAISRLNLEPALPSQFRAELDFDILKNIEDLSLGDTHFFQANLVRAVILMEQVLARKESLDRALFQLGALDFYASVAAAKLPYVDFVEASMPKLVAKNLRHPSLPVETAIKNDVDLTQMLLTGPNASGKSTLMRAVGANVIYLAQTLGVATADALTMTPFHSFYAFMETQDKTGESSSYQTELRRIVDCLRVQQKLGSENKFSFYLADELFSSTNAVDALVGSQEILDRFVKLPNSIGIVSTHLASLHSKQNYHMNRYRLAEGPSTERNALKILREAMEDSKDLPEQSLSPQSTSRGPAVSQILFDILKPDFVIPAPGSSPGQALSRDPWIPRQARNDNVAVDSDIWVDLELLEAVKKLFPTQTLFGEVWAQLFVTHGAITDPLALLTRQNEILTLGRNSQKLERIRQQLDIIRAFEQPFLEIYDESDWINSKSVRWLYHADEDLPVRMLEKVLPKQLDERERAKLIEANFNSTRAQNRSPALLASNHFVQNYLSLPLTFLYNYKISKWVWTSSASMPMKAVHTIWSLMGLEAVLRNPLGQHERLSELTPKFLQKLKDVATVCRAVLELSALGLDISPKDQKLFAQFIWETGSLGDVNTHFFQWDLAKALSVFRLLMDIRKPLAGYFSQIGKLDFGVSVFRQVQEHPEKISFAKYSASSESYLNAKNLWNPLLAMETAVPNDVSMGGPKSPQHILVTGPNASGKSTLMRAVAINIYLAQTVGVVAAQSFELAPFTVFNSFMKHEDKVGEESSYQSEVRKMRKMMTLYKTMKPNDRAFMILDEPFRSTNPDEAEEASRIVLQNLEKYPQGLMMVATHLKSLAHLGANRHLEHYRLCDGVGTESSALPLLMEQLANH